LFKGQKESQTLFVVLPFLCHKETSKLQEYHEYFFSKLRLSLAWDCTRAHYWCFFDFSCSMRLHTAYNRATICILIHRQLSAPIQKSPPIHSCTYDQNHKSTSLTSLSHFYRAVADLSASVEPAECLAAYNTVHTAQCTHFQWLRKNLISKLASLKYYSHQKPGIGPI